MYSLLTPHAIGGWAYIQYLWEIHSLWKWFPGMPLSVIFSMIGARF
jgi:hypothetical protein